MSYVNFRDIQTIQITMKNKEKGLNFKEWRAYISPQKNEKKHTWLVYF